MLSRYFVDMIEIISSGCRQPPANSHSELLHFDGEYLGEYSFGSKISVSCQQKNEEQ